MQAKQTRYRHFRSSVGTLLNENYGAVTNKKRPPVILSTAPASPNVPLSPKTPEIFAAQRSRPGLVVYGTTAVSGISDRQSPQTCAGHDELDGTHCNSEDTRASLTPTSSGTPVGSQTRKYDRPCSQTTSFSRSTQGPASRYAQINGSNTSSRPQTNSSVACRTSTNSSVACRTSTNSSVACRTSTNSSVACRTSTNSSVACRTSTCTPKSERSLPLSSTRVHTPLGIPEDQINLEVPRYYDAYKHMFDLTSKHGSSRLDDVIVEQDSKNLDAIPDRSDITWPRIIRKNQEENVLKRCSTSRSSRVSSARSHVFSNDIFTPSPRPTGLSANMTPAGFIRSKSATSSASSQRVSSGSRSSCGQRDNGANSAKTSRSSAGYDDTVSRLLLEVKMQQPGEWYTGHTPTHTPTPDSSLPYYQSRSWLKHYSPTKIRHFFRAAGGSMFSGSIS
ncbi:uncharacterized protein LOC131952452 [Physella acuta]|uniref:uncharacterized protein LOC131952452 n=1 Tax=Physella acuta TaxID=109671 RepID=UPI0027DE1DD6|nr:uncharacterized protein LOC131952452 [Physella acuta]